jgi:hypothetical protein
MSKSEEVIAAPPPPPKKGFGAFYHFVLFLAALATIYMAFNGGAN